MKTKILTAVVMALMLAACDSGAQHDNTKDASNASSTSSTSNASDSSKVNSQSQAPANSDDGTLMVVEEIDVVGPVQNDGSDAQQNGNQATQSQSDDQQDSSMNQDDGSSSPPATQSGSDNGSSDGQSQSSPNMQVSLAANDVATQNMPTSNANNGAFQEQDVRDPNLSITTTPTDDLNNKAGAQADKAPNAMNSPAGSGQMQNPSSDTDGDTDGGMSTSSSTATSA